MKDELMAFQEDRRVVRQGNKMSIQVLGPEQIHEEMNSLAKNILGEMPDLPATLTGQQVVFLTSFYTEVMNIPKALKTARITRRTLTQWMQTDVVFAECYQDVLTGIKEVLQSIVVKNALYSKDAKLMIKLLESWFPETYSRDASAQNSKHQEQMEVAAMLQELRNGK